MSMDNNEIAELKAKIMETLKLLSNDDVKKVLEKARELQASTK